MSTLYVNNLTPNSGGTVSISGSLYVSGNITLGDTNTDGISFGADVSSSIVPDANNTYELGSSSSKWSNVHATNFLGLATSASYSLISSTAANAVTASHLNPNGAAPSQNSITSLGVLTGLNVLNTASFQQINILGSVSASGGIIGTLHTSPQPAITSVGVLTSLTCSGDISASGTVFADNFQSAGGDDTISFTDNMFLNGAMTIQGTISSSGAITSSGFLGALTGNADSATSASYALNASAVGANDVNIIALNDIALSAPDDISLTSTSADGLITLHSAHTAGQSILIDANANAGSILDVDAGILDIDIQGAATIDAASITLTGAVTAVNGVQNATVTITATDDGSGTGTIPAGTATVLVNANGDANHIVILPAPIVGNIIHIIENGTTGYELRSTDPTSIAINGGTASSGESAVAGAVTYLKCVCVSSTAWIVSQFDADGDESKLEAAA